MTLREHLNEITAQLNNLRHDIHWDNRQESTADGRCRLCHGGITVNLDTFDLLEQHTALFTFPCVPDAVAGGAVGDT